MKMDRNSYLLYGLSLLFFLHISFHSQAQSCDFIEGLDKSDRISCGTLEVPENHDNPTGRKIQISYVLVKAEQKDSKNFPVIYFSGGPGGGSIHPGRIEYMQHSPVAKTHDLIIFDQRGIGHSSALPNMGADFLALMRKDANEEEEQKLMQGLLQKYKEICAKKGIQVADYNSFQNARDVGKLMEYLGYSKYNIYGGSYGTRLGRIVQDMFPEMIHSSIMNSPNPMGDDFLIDRLKSYSLALSRIFDYCDNTPECKSQYANLEVSYLKAINRMKTKPLELMVKGKPFYVNAQDAIYFLRRKLYGNDSRSTIPKLIMAYEAGKGKIIEETILGEIIFDDFYNSTMWISVERYEAFHKENTPQRIAEIYKTLPLLPARLGIFTAIYIAGKNWHDSTLPMKDRDFKQSSIPTLIMVNHYDPVTPPKNGYIFQKKLDNSFLFVLDEGGHGGGNQACRDKVILRFMADPKKNPDPGCLNIYEGDRRTKDGRR